MNVPGRPRPTVRGLGVAVACGGLALFGTLTSSSATAPLVAMLAVAWLLAGASVWHERNRYSSRDDSHDETTNAALLAVHASVVPAMVPVGGESDFRIVIVNRSTHRLAPLSYSPSELKWRPEQTPNFPPLPEETGATGLGAATKSKKPRTAPIPDRSGRVGALSPGQVLTVRIPAPTGRRGVFSLPPFALWTHDRFGLWGAPVALIPRGVVVVYPVAKRVSSPQRGDLLVRGLPDLGVASATLPIPSDGTGDFADLRPYIPGDRLHLIHWPSLARYGTPLVRRFEQEESSPFTIVLDDRARAHRRAEFEVMVQTALAMIEEVADRGRAVAFSTLSGSRVVLAGDEDTHARLLWMLANATPHRIGTHIGPHSELFSLNADVGGPHSPGPHSPGPHSPWFTLVTSPSGVATLSDAIRRGAEVIVA
ncbi:MAG: DUF58 domain-containing protein [Acidimicrobiales bacterium]